MKPCFGDYMGKTCEGHRGCAHELECSRKYNTEKGECDCKYKKSCHIPRQHVRTSFPDMPCNFYGYFEEDAKS